MGADGIELDVHCTADGEVVVMHDETLDRMTNGKGPVASLPLAELKKLTLQGGEPIATLSEALRVVGKRALVYVEVKRAQDAVAAAKVLDKHIAQGWDSKKLWLISFAHAGLKEAQEAVPKLLIGASLKQCEPSSVADAKALGARAVLPAYRTVTREFVAQAHAQGLEVIVWTVNTPQDIARMRELGVDGIISDYPDRVLP